MRRLVVAIVPLALLAACELDTTGAVASPDATATGGTGAGASGGTAGVSGGAAGSGTGGAAGTAGSGGSTIDAGPDAPPDAGFSIGSVPQLLAWYAETVVQEPAGSVATWSDKSGNALDVVQSDPAKRPQFVATDPALNGSPSLRFDGSSLASAQAPAWQFLHDGSGMTVFIVAISQGNQTLDSLFDTAAGSSSNFGTYVRHDSTKQRLHFYVFNGNPTSVPITTTLPEASFPLNTPVVITLAYAENHAPTEYVVRINGAEIGSGDTAGQPGNAPPTHPLQIGARGPTSAANFRGKMAELAMFKRRLTDVEIAAVESDLATRHGIALATP